MSEKSTEQQLREALKKAREFIKNGSELGYIRMPTGPDTANDTPRIIDAALALPVTPVRREYRTSWNYKWDDLGPFERALPHDSLASAIAHLSALVGREGFSASELAHYTVCDCHIEVRDAASEWILMEEKD